MEFDSSQPIWLQLVAEFSRRIAVGEWAPGRRIAGVRELALQLGVNPNTVQRAFGELERVSLVQSERTTGRFVTDDPSLVADLRRRAAAEVADDFIRRVTGFGMTLTDAQELIETRWTDADHAIDATTGEGR